jgi:hypothetical protein
MNQRIKELAEQAGYSKDYLEIGLPSNMEKFAELIVRECANELIKWKDEPFPYDPEFGAKLIKQHFRVE